jgi:hypothetical protein
MMFHHDVLHAEVPHNATLLYSVLPYSAELEPLLGSGERGLARQAQLPQARNPVDRGLLGGSVVLHCLGCVRLLVGADLEMGFRSGASSIRCGHDIITDERRKRSELCRHVGRGALLLQPVIEGGRSVVRVWMGEPPIRHGIEG